MSGYENNSIEVLRLGCRTHKIRGLSYLKIIIYSFEIKIKLIHQYWKCYMLIVISP